MQLACFFLCFEKDRCENKQKIEIEKALMHCLELGERKKIVTQT